MTELNVVLVFQIDDSLFALRFEEAKSYGKMQMSRSVFLDFLLTVVILLAKLHLFDFVNQMSRCMVKPDSICRFTDCFLK